MTIAELIHQATARLVTAGCDSPRLDAELLLAYALQQERAWLYLHFKTALTADQRADFESLLQRREAREPLAYITGHKAFYGLDFHVTPHVLIPRPETELIIETCLTFPKKPNTPLTIADIGTGSGCIAITLATLLPQATIFAVDISKTALQTAQHNADRHGVRSQITFLHGNLLEPLPQPVDLLISNPPYVTATELAHEVSPEVSQYEPRLALDGGDHDGLALIRQLFQHVQPKLTPNGWLLIEIGSGQGEAVKQVAERQFPQANIELKQDLSRQNRLFVGRCF